MGFLDRAKEAASRAKSQARVAREQGQQRIEDLQARRQAELLLREVGLAAHEEHRGEGGHEAVVRALAKLDEHIRSHPIDLATTGLRGYVRTATGGGTDDTAAPPERQGADPADRSRPDAGDEKAADDKTDAAEAGEPKEKKESGGSSAASDEKSATSTPSMATGAGSATKPSTTKKAAAKKPAAKKSTAKPTKKAAEKPSAEKEPTAESGDQDSTS